MSERSDPKEPTEASRRHLDCGSFADQMRRELDRLEADWLERRNRAPDDYPAELSMDDWLQLFFMRQDVPVMYI